jgi:hypothetical protein
MFLGLLGFVEYDAWTLGGIRLEPSFVAAARQQCWRSERDFHSFLTRAKYESLVFAGEDE